MNLFGMNITKAQGDPIREILPQGISMGWDTSLPVQWTWQAYVNAYKSWVYIAVDKIARAVAMLPLELFIYRDVRTQKLVDGREVKLAMQQCENDYERRMYLKSAHLEKEPVTQHPWLQLMQRPNAVTVRYTLWYDTLMKMELGGSCGWYMPRGALGIPTEIYVLPLTSTARLTPIPDSIKLIKGYKYEDGQVREVFEPEDVMFLHYPSPRGPLEGMSALRAQTYPYQVDDYIEKLQYYMFKNRAVPGLNLHTDTPLKTKQINEIKEQIQSSFASAKDTGKLFITHSGLQLGKPLNQSFKDLVLTKVEESQKDKMLAAYDVPAGLVGLVKDVNRANLEALKESFYGETIRSKTMLIEENIEAFMLPMYDERLTCDFRLPEISQRETDLKERDQNLKTGYTTINEERAKESKEEVDWGHRPWMAANLIQDTGEPTEPVKTKSMVVVTADTKTLDKVWKAYERQHSTYEKLLLTTAKKLFTEQEESVVAKMTTETDKMMARFTAPASKGRTRFIKQNGVATRIFDPTHWQQVTVEKFRPIFEYIWQDAGDQQMARLTSSKALGIDFNVNDPRAAELLGNRLDKFSTEITGTTFGEVEAVLTSGWEAGLSSSVIADNLASMFTAAEKYRAPLISRTEATAASNQADLEAVRQAGLEQVMLKVWVSSRDSSTRDTHLAAEDAYREGIALDESFSVGEDSMEAPGMGNVAAENINCRCTVAYIKRKEG